MNKMSRQEFLTRLAWGSVGIEAALIGLGSFRFLIPNLTFGPPPMFKIGKPEDYPPGSQTFLRDSRLFIVSTEKGIIAMSAVCTHLGCTVGRVEWGYQCPCHGSKFDSNGDLLAGPAPKSLPWFKVIQGPDKYLIVDRWRTVPRGTFFRIA